MAWIARDKDGSLVIYDKKPRRYETQFNCCNQDGLLSCILDEFFPEVTWENSPIELTIKEE